MFIIKGRATYIGLLVKHFLNKTKQKVTVQPCHSQKGEIEKVFKRSYPQKTKYFYVLECIFLSVYNFNDFLTVFPLFL